MSNGFSIVCVVGGVCESVCYRRIGDYVRKMKSDVYLQFVGCSCRNIVTICISNRTSFVLRTFYM